MGSGGIHDVLKRNVTDESIAYGYTLTIWGSGAFLIQALGLTTFNILSYVAGGVTGFALMASFVFSGLLGDVYGQSERDRLIVASMIHILASFGTVFISYLLVTGLQGALTDAYIYFLIGVHATVTYNIMLVLEEFISVKLYDLEQWLLE